MKRAVVIASLVLANTGVASPVDTPSPTTQAPEVVHSDFPRSEFSDRLSESPQSLTHLFLASQHDHLEDHNSSTYYASGASKSSSSSSLATTTITSHKGKQTHSEAEPEQESTESFSSERTLADSPGTVTVTVRLLPTLDPSKPQTSGGRRSKSGSDALRPLSLLTTRMQTNIGYRRFQGVDLMVDNRTFAPAMLRSSFAPATLSLPRPDA